MGFRSVIGSDFGADFSFLSVIIVIVVASVRPSLSTWSLGGSERTLGVLSGATYKWVLLGRGPPALLSLHDGWLLFGGKACCMHMYGKLNF